jgi:hypothetical protein
MLRTIHDERETEVHLPRGLSITEKGDVWREATKPGAFQQAPGLRYPFKTSPALPSGLEEA